MIAGRLIDATPGRQSVLDLAVVSGYDRLVLWGKFSQDRGRVSALDGKLIGCSHHCWRHPHLRHRQFHRYSHRKGNPSEVRQHGRE